MDAAALPVPSALSTGRAIAPDLARGVMLLFIVIANAPWYLWAADTGLVTSHPTGATGADAVAQTIAIVAIDGRSYPMFAFLFGYGIWQLYSRQLAAGVATREARRLLRRRHLWMLAFGAVHALLLWMGDIVGGYGLAGLVLVALFLDRPDRVIRIWSIVFAAVLVIFVVGAAFFVAALDAFLGADLGATVDEPDPIAESNYGLSALLRFGFWLVISPAQGLGFVVPIAVLLAFIAARHRVLEQPAAHLALLRRTAIIGISVGWIVGAVVALQHFGVLGMGTVLDVAILGLGSIAGLACGIGYVAVFALIAARMQRSGRSGAIATALQAVGKRSLTFYLAQSVIFAPIMSAWGLGLGAELTSWSIMLFAIAVWILSVIVASVLERFGIRGPAEVLLRRLAYPRKPLRTSS